MNLTLLIVHLTPFVAATTFHDSQRLFHWLLGYCPQYRQHVLNLNIDQNTISLINTLQYSINDGRVLGEITRTFRDIDYRAFIDEKRRETYISAFRAYFDIYPHNLWPADELIRLDFVEGLLRPLIPPSSIPVVVWASPANALEEFVSNERKYVTKLFRIYYYVEDLKVRNPSHIKPIETVFAGLFDLTKAHQRLSIYLDIPFKPIDEKIVEYFYVFTTELEAVYTRWIASRCDDSQILQPILKLQAGTFSDCTIDTFASSMIAPIQYLCRLPLMLDSIYKSTKNNKFAVLQKQIQQLTERLNALRRCVDIKHKIANGHQVEEILDYQSITDVEQIQVSWDGQVSKKRIICRYNRGYLLLKDHNSVYLVAGLVLDEDISLFEYKSDRTLVIVFYSDDRKFHLSIQFDQLVAEKWYDEYVLAAK